METNEMIEWLQFKKTDDEYHVPDIDIEIINEIIKRLEELERLRKLYGMSDVKN